MEKVGLPIKTKIAAWMLRIIGIIGIIATIIIGMWPPLPPLLVAPSFFLTILTPPFILSLFVLWTVPSLFRKDKRAWKKSVLLSSLIGIGAMTIALIYIMESAFLGGYGAKTIDWAVVPLPLIIAILFFIPLILLLLDRKEFFQKEEMPLINKFINRILIRTVIAIIFIGCIVYLWQVEDFFL